MSESADMHRSQRVAPYVSWEAFPADRRSSGIGGSKPMGMVCAYVRDDNSDERTRKIIDVPSDVAKRLASLRKGQPEDSVTRYDELKELVLQTKRQVAKERILRLVNRRDYSRFELEERLSRDGFERDVCVGVLDELADCGIVSDARFAEIYVRSKMSAGWGAERIVRELEKRGIDVNDLDGWPYEFFDPADEFGRAVAVAQKKCSGSRILSYQQVVRFLMGRGFSCNVACGAAKEVV